MKENHHKETIYGISYLQAVWFLGAVLFLVVIVFLGGTGSKPFSKFSTKRRSTKSKKRSTRQGEEDEREISPEEWQKPERFSSPSNYNHTVDPPSQQSHGYGSLKRGTWPRIQEPIPAGSFTRHFHEMASTEPSGFCKEFQRLAQADGTRCSIASREYNLPKNRFKNIKTYDDTRVTLSTGNSLSSDYINASYMQGVNPRGDTVQNMYIATQGPLDRTIPDFWQMIWEQRCPFIVMLTNPIENRKVKCAIYWPEKGQYRDVNIMQLLNIQEEVWPFFVRRTIEMIKDGLVRTVTHYQFTSWDDKETLETAMPIWDVLNEMWAQIETNGFKGPIAVHCSAGIGRTGTFIALDTLRSILQTKQVVDVFNVISDMRSRRMMMIQVEEQYKFLYESLLIFNILKQTSFKVTRFKQDMKHWWKDMKNRQRNRAEKEFKLLNFVCPPKRYGKQLSGELRENRNKNRFEDKIPNDEHRPLLMTMPTMDPNPNSYINASFHHSFQHKNAFIATQSPLPVTIGAFWSLVLDYQVATIVMFDEGERECPVYWPNVYEQTQYGNISIRCTREDQLTHQVKSRQFTLRLGRKTGNVKQICVQGRQDKTEMADCMTDVVKYVRDWQRETGNNPILVHCRSGLGLAGSFMAIYSAIDRLNTQHVVDVFTTVRRLRHTRPNVVDTKDGYEMIYEALNVYLVQTEKSYSNFQDF